MILYLYGQPSSGKTTISRHLSTKFQAVVVDGDEIRQISGNTDYSLKGRVENITLCQNLAAFLEEKLKMNVILALVSPIATLREEFAKKRGDCHLVCLSSQRSKLHQHQCGYFEMGKPHLILWTDTSEKSCAAEVEDFIRMKSGQHPHQDR